MTTRIKSTKSNNLQEAHRLLRTMDLSFEPEIVREIKQEIKRMKKEFLNHLKSKNLSLPQEDRKQLLITIRDLAIEFLWGDVRGKDF